MDLQDASFAFWIGDGLECGNRRVWSFIFFLVFPGGSLERQAQGRAKIEQGHYPYGNVAKGEDRGNMVSGQVWRVLRGEGERWSRWCIRSYQYFSKGKY